MFSAIFFVVCRPCAAVVSRCDCGLPLWRLVFSGNVKHMEISLQVCACEWCFRRPCCLLRQMRHSRGCCRKPLSCCGLPPAFGILCLAMGGVVWLFRCKKGDKCGLSATSASLATMHYGLYCKAKRAVWRRGACVFEIPHALFRLAAPGTRHAEMLNFRTISLQYAGPPLLPCRSHCVAKVLPVGFFCVLLPPWT